jgi:quercetin dioxygenase-like cupin family protein
MSPQKKEAKIVNLNDAQSMTGLIEYQTGAVVSRTLIDKQAGTVTLFAFDEGQGLSEHKAPFDALVYVIDGQVVITISGKPHNLSAGEMIIMPANELHALKAAKRFKMLLVMVKSM